MSCLRVHPTQSHTISNIYAFYGPYSFISLLTFSYLHLISSCWHLASRLVAYRPRLRSLTIPILPGAALNKYASMHRFRLQAIPTAAGLFGSHDFSGAGIVPTACQAVINSSVSRATWGKYSSALNTFSAFEMACGTSFHWPLSPEICRAFVIWCHSARRLKSTTIMAYLSALKFVHTLRGLPNAHLSTDQFTSLLIKGVSHIDLASNPSTSTRRVFTFPLLLLFSDRVALTSWSPLTKQVIWAAATTAFFGSLRMGEILASSDTAFAPASDLTWNDIRKSSDTSLLIRLKQPKSGATCEFVDLFQFKGFHCCPVAALRALKAKQLAAGMDNPELPVFRFASGRNLTHTALNDILAELFADICQPGVNSVSCHSFRAGIPSTLALFPDIVNNDMIKGWGRWNSDCYEKYTRLKLPQKEKIFSSISDALRSTVPPQ